MDHNDLSKETKLSEVIEEALVSGVYIRSCHYMCIALRRMHKEHHTHAVHQMVMSIHSNPQAYADMPLICALNDAGIYSMANHTNIEQNAYTTQLYCWWVYDLKRKGL